MFKAGRDGVAVLCLLAASTGAHAVSQVTVSGIFGDKALVSVNGGAPKVLGAGERLDGVRLIGVEHGKAVLEIDGARRVLGLGTTSGGGASSTGKSLILMADGHGHFYGSGQVNQTGVRFLVDTGASVVSLPRSVAERAGVRLEDAKRAALSTAGGVVPAWRVRLNQVSLGPISLNLIEAVVVEDRNLPVALLGMSFLSRTRMSHEGDRLVMTQRY